jgi:hypothetical protein
VSEGLAKDLNYAGSMLRRWSQDGLVKAADKHNYKKVFKDIPE